MLASYISHLDQGAKMVLYRSHTICSDSIERIIPSFHPYPSFGGQLRSIFDYVTTTFCYILGTSLAPSYMRINRKLASR